MRFPRNYSLNPKHTVPSKTCEVPRSVHPAATLKPPMPRQITMADIIIDALDNDYSEY